MNTLSKIKSVDEIAEEVKIAKSRGLKVVQCQGEFDLLHLGHARHFREAKNFGDLLVVIVTPDRFITKGPGRPFFSEELRAEAIANLQFVDFVAINEWPTAEESMKKICPDIYVKGSEYLNKVDVTGRLDIEKDLIESLGGTMKFTHDVIFSSSKLLNNYFEVYSKESWNYLNGLAKSCKAMDIVDFLDRIKTLKILVVGDASVDQHWLCSNQGQNQGIPILKDEINRPMGALAVINVLADFCDNIDYLTIEPENKESKALINAIVPEGVNSYFIKQEAYESPTLVNYWEEKTFHPLWKVKNHPITPLSQQTEELFVKWILNQKEYDAILVVDLGMGTITKTLIQTLRERSSFMAVCMENKDAYSAIDSLQQYSSINYLCIEESLLAPNLQNPSFSFHKQIYQIPFEDNRANITLTQQNEGIKFWDGIDFTQLPLFMDQSAPSIPHDINSTIFAVTAPLAMLKINSEWQQFVSNAVREMARQSKEDLFKLQRMLLDKFLIALLNR